MSDHRTPIDILSVHRAAQVARAQAVGRVFAGVGRWIARYTVNPLKAALQRRAQYEQLLAMDERQLRDLGLSRANIAHAMEFGREDVPAAANVNKPAAGAPRAA